MRILSVLSLLVFSSLSFAQTPHEIAAKAAHLKAVEIIAEQSKPGPWPKELPFPDGLVRYTRAEWSQSIYVLSGYGDRIDPVHRSRLKAKWHQSGGMEGISGYRSDVYKMVPVPPKVYVGNIKVWNGVSFQSNRGWKREYPSGTMFIDALSKDGEPFEIRQRVKEDGKWRSSVIYVNEAARPKGYAGLKQSCSSCHDSAGSGGYATGLVPGGDETLSDPFAALER